MSQLVITSRLAIASLASVLLIGCAGQSSMGAGSASTWVTPEQAEAIAIAQEARIDQLLTEAKASRESGMSDRALAAFGQAIEVNPRLTEAHLGMGDIFRERGTYENASNAYRRAIQSDPNNFDARYFYGLTSQLKNDLQRAVSSYERALIIRPNSFVANRDIASALLQSGRFDDAIRYAKRAVELDSESQEAWANLAVAYFYTDRFVDAIQAYRQTLELGDAQPQILLGLADAHMRLGNNPRAENVLRAVLRDSPDNMIAKERLANVMFKQQKFEQAVAAYREVLSYDPNDIAALNGLGVSLMALYLQGGENDDRLRHRALSSWRRSLDVRPGQTMLIDLISRYSKE